MRKSRFYGFAFICFLLVAGVFGQKDDVRSETFLSETVKSEVLGENRELTIYLPPGYSASDQSYPVLYLLDGKEHIFHTAGIVRYLVSVGRIPEIIVVGIHSTDRFRDYTPDELEHHEGTGGADRFTEFLSGELFDYIEERYRIEKYRMIFGHSYGGTYVVNLLLTNSRWFGDYIAASPNLSIIKSLEKKIENAPKNPAPGDQTLYMTVGEHEKDFIAQMAAFNDWLESAPIHGFEWKSEILRNENHTSTPHKTIYTALEFIFGQFWRFGDDTDGSKIKEQFVSLSRKLGYDIQIPLSALVNLGNSALGSGNLNQAQSIFELLVELYPESDWGYVSLGSVFYSKKDYLKAKEYFRKALIINPSNPYTRDMLKELDKKRMP